MQISGEIKGVDLYKDEKKENETLRRVERPRGKFRGVLTLTIPKQEIKKPEVKTIEIN